MEYFKHQQQEFKMSAQFSEINGHNDIKIQLHQALKTNRLCSGLLFSGPSGVGKRKTAWVLIQYLLCKEEDPCGKCYNCVSVKKRENENVFCVNHETLQIRLQDVKGVLHFLSLQSSSRKIVLVDSAELLNPQASNFLLKIVEEPPPRSFFFFISSSPSRLLPTLRSRLQNLRFKALPEKVLRELAPQDSPDWLIRGARGSLEFLEKSEEHTDIRERSFDLWSEMLEKSFSALIMDFPKKVTNRKAALTMCHFWQQILRDVRFLKSGYSDQIIHGDKEKELKRLSRLPCGVLDTFIKKTLEMEVDIQAGINPVLCFEDFVITAKKTIPPPLLKKL